MAEKYLKTNELAARLRVEPSTARWWRYVGKGPAYIKIGGTVLYSEADIEAFIAAGRHEPSAASAPAA